MNKEKNKTLKETFALAVQNFQSKDFKAAELLCRKILSIDNNHFDSTFLLANLQVIDRNFQEAKKLLLKANKIKHKNGKKLLELALGLRPILELKRNTNCVSKAKNNNDIV